MLDRRALAMPDIAHTISLLSLRSAAVRFKHLESLWRWRLSVMSSKQSLFTMISRSSSSMIEVTVASGGFIQLERACSSFCGYGKLLLTYGLHRTLSLLLAIVAESVLPIKDLMNLDVHLHMGVISHVQSLDATSLTASLR